MPTPDDVRGVARQLVAPGTTPSAQLKIVTDLRDSVDVVHVALPEVLSGLVHVLETSQPQNEQNEEHKLRKSSIEVLHRVPHTTALKDHVPRLAACLQSVALQDNQENAIVAMKVVLDLMRAFKPELEEAAIPMLEVFVKLYTCWGDTYRHYFSDGFGDMAIDEDPAYLEMQPSTRSFRLVAECPLAVLHLHQLYGERIQPHVPPLVDLMVQALGIGPSEAPPNLRQVFRDLKFAQVKTLAFLSHYIRQAPSLMQPYERAICDSLVNLLNTCPDVVLWRKELLISMRTVLATDFKKTLNERLDDFKEEEALVGKSRECYEVLRHYGYAVFAELAHQTRTTLKVPQLSWIVHRSCCIIHDPARPASSHSTAVRLLGNLVEVIHKYRVDLTVADKCRDLLRKILDCFVVKLNHVRNVPKLNPELGNLLQFIFIGLRTVLYSLAYKRGPPAREPLKEEEVRLAAKILKGGLDCLKLCSKQTGSQGIMEVFTEVFTVMDAWDFVEIMTAKMDYMFESIKTDADLLGLIDLLLEKKQAGLHFIDILGAYLADKKLSSLENPESEVLLEMLTSDADRSPDLHFNHLCYPLTTQELDPESQLVLQLFSRIFRVFARSDINQIFDAPDTKFRFVSTLSRVVEQCLELIQSKPKPQGYLRLLWFLFKSKIHFQELDSLMLPALELFLSMLEGPDVGIHRDKIVELCLLLPLELEKKYPILYKLMKPLVRALKGRDDIVAVGIETLEEWVDRLNPEFLEPAMSTVVEELNLALWSHLRPQPYPFGPKVLQLLGKLGGRNRRFLKNPLHLDCKDNSEHGLRLILTFHPETKFLVPLDKCIALARKGLDGRAASSAGHNAVYYRRQALKFLHGCLAAMMNLYTPDKKSVDIDALRVLCEQYPAVRVDRSASPKTEEQSTKTKSQLAAEKQVLITLISSVIAACSDSELSEVAELFAKGVCRHFAILFALGHGISSTPKNLFQEVSSSKMQIDPMMKDLDVVLFLDALVEVLSSDEIEQAKTGEQALRWFVEMLLELHPTTNVGPGSLGMIDIPTSSQSEMKRKEPMSATMFGLPPVLDVLLPKIINCCFKDDWQSRMGGMVAVGVIIEKVPQNYLMHITPRLLHALLNVLRALPSYSVADRETVRELLKRLLQLALGLGETEDCGPVISSVPFDCIPVRQAIEKLSTTVLSQHTPPITRQYSNECLSIVAGAFLKPVADIVNPYALAPTSSIRSALEEWKAAVMKLRNVKHVNMEGISCALTYAITLRLPALEDVLKDVLDFVRNIVVVCDYTEDTLKTKYGPRVTNQKSFHQLRESGLELLVAVTDWPVFVNLPDIKEKPNNLKNFLKPILKKLTLPNEKLREIAKKGLANLIRHEVIHQRLSECLKPTLSRISQYQTLDLQLLNGAAVALELVPEWFNQADGEKLLEHLRKWIDPDAHNAVQRPWPLEDDTKIAAALLELFHLLPSSAATFLETLREHTTNQRIGLVVLTIELEDRLGRVATSGPLPRVLWSPYRGPLTKFLVKYAKESVQYFLSPTRMQNSYFMRFTDIIKSEMGRPLLQELLNSPDQILVVLTGDAMIPDPRGASRVPVLASIHALHLVRILVKLAPEWLCSQRSIVDQLIEMWRSQKRLDRLAREEELSQIEVLESKVIAKCLLNFINAKHEEVSPLLEIVSIFVHKTKVDFTFIRNFCKETVAKQYTYNERRLVLHHVFEALMNGHLLEDHAVFALRVIVNPILSHLAEQKDMDKVVTIDLVKIFVRIVKAKEIQGKVSERDVCLEVELLEVGKILIIGVPRLVDDHSCKDLLKYAWNFLKCENLECKSHAFLLVAHILSAYALTDMIMLQVFVNLLKSDFAETKKHLIREALDVLVPALVGRFQAEEEQDFPIWIRYAHKHMLAEGHKLNLLINLWQMVVRHPDLFYKFRTQFLAQMVNTLSRLRLPANASMENRRMAVDMARVIVEWEVRRVKSSTASQPSGTTGNPAQIPKLPIVKKEEDNAPVGGPTDSQPQTMSIQPLLDDAYVNMTRMVVTFLAKMAFTLATDSRDEDCRALYDETMHVLHCALDIWQNVDFRLDFVEKLLEGNRPPSHDLTPVLVTGLDLVNAALEKQPAVFVEHGWRQIYFLADRVMVMQKEELVVKLCSALNKVYIAAKDSHQVKMVQEAIERQLLTKYLDPTVLGQQAPGEFEVAACLKILASIADVSPQTVVRFMGPMIKLLEQYSKECGMGPQLTPSQMNAERRSQSPPVFGTVLYNVCSILRLTGPRIHCCSGPAREYLLKTMLEFVFRRSSKPPDRAIFLEILHVVEGWLKDPESLTGDGLGSKEIIWALQQIARLDAQGLVDVMTKKQFEDSFLEMLYKLCTTAELPQEFRQEVFVHVEQGFLAGFRSTDPTIRSKFFELYKPRVGTTLFARLKYILQNQEWEQMASRFWLKQALDFLLAILCEEEPITLSPNSAHVVALPHHVWRHNTDGDKMSVEEAGVGVSLQVKSEGNVKLELRQEETEVDKLQQILNEHAVFLQMTGNFTVRDLIHPLREYAHVDAQLAYHLWVLVFPIVWATLDKSNQVSLAKPVITLLSKEYHRHQASSRPNVVQALLEGISLSQPQPKIPPELIKYLGKTYNAWHIAIPLLESHVVIFPDELRCFDALAELYRLVSETDVMYGLLKKWCVSDYTRAGLSLVQYGYWDKAAEVFGEACKQEDQKAPPREEWVWTEEWVKCNRELNRWEELHHFGLENSLALAADCAWHLPKPEWQNLKKLVHTRKDQFPDSSRCLMLSIYSALHDGDIATANTSIKRAMQQALARWWQLPEVGVAPQGQLLQSFQSLVELCESTRALNELNPSQPGSLRPEHSYARLKDILETWRLRTPNEWEPLSHWCDVLMWRHQIYSITANKFNNLEPAVPHLRHLGVRDKAWSINRLASVARRHGSCDVCIEIVNNMYNYSFMDVQEAFIKIVEQAKAYLAMPEEQKTGLNMLYSTNLEYFPHQGLQSEIFRLKGMFHQALNETELANQCFSTSVALNHQLPEAWLCWGAFCDEIYEQTKGTSGNMGQLEYAVGSYLQAIQLQSAAALNMLPRCLQLLSFDETGTVVKAFQAFELPSWIWLFYIPQLLVGLHRQEGKVLRQVLHRMVLEHPQSLYFYLRVYMLSSREALSKLSKLSKLARQEHQAAQQAAQQAYQHGHPGSVPVANVEGMHTDDGHGAVHLQPEHQTECEKFEAAKELMDRLKQQLGPMAGTLDLILREIASKFIAKPEERLMAVVHALLTRCYKVPASQNSDVPKNLVDELDGVCRACFPEARGTNVHRDLRESFVQHLNPSAEGFPRTLGELTNHLKCWRNRLSAYLDDEITGALQLHVESPTLQEIDLTGVEMPCQHSTSLDPVGDGVVFLEKIGSQVAIVRRQGSALRRLMFYGSNGHVTHYILQSGHVFSQPASSDEHMMQLLRLMNRLLDKHPPCRSRSLNWFAPVIIPVWTQVRLVEEDPSYTTYFEAYEMNCTRYGREPDHPVLHFKKIIHGQPQGLGHGQGQPNESNVRYNAFTEILKFYDTNVFSQFMYKILPSCNHLWVFKRQFCAQMALSSLMSLMLRIGSRVPGKILFTKSSGRVYQMEFAPQFDASGLLQRNHETVPFRLTRNLATFFTPFGVEGIFITAMVVAVEAIFRTHTNIESCLAMLFRDELLARSSKHKSRNLPPMSNETLRLNVEKNVQTAVKQLQKLLPIIPSGSGPPECVNQGARELVEKEAQNPYRLCWMEPTWHPWY